MVPTLTTAEWHPPGAFEEYRLLRLLGRGGMGEVYLAQDTLLDRLVAAKFIGVLDPEHGSREQFLNEARSSARLQHPNVVTIYRVGELERRPFIISEFVRGKGLHEIETPVPWKRAHAIGVGLARGLAAAHRRGVLHRDIKPGNAIITDEGDVKLLDFGLAKCIDKPVLVPSLRISKDAPTLDIQDVASVNRSKTTAPSVDLPSGLRGTPYYIAPELWRGERATRQSDVYSLGIVLFELCSGKPPHMDTPLEHVGHDIQTRPPPPLMQVAPSVDPRFAAIVDRCLRSDPAERFASGEELREALEQITRDLHATVVPEGNPYRGLLPFEAEHRALYFGRSGEVGAVVDRLRSESFVFVVGDSGVGKSSLCRAGVLPLLAEGALGEGRIWSQICVTPGRHPLATLSSAISDILGTDEDVLSSRLRSTPTVFGRNLRKQLGERRGLVLFIDQLEELVTISDPEEARVVSEMLGQLALRIRGVRFLVALRSDFIARIASLPGIGEEVSRSLYLLRPLSPERIREAIVGPARVKGVSFESAQLVDELVASTIRPEGLPLLQFALAELWEARDPVNGITSEALAAIGGVAGALARHASSVLLGLPPEQRTEARRILVTLVTAERTRARRTEDELCGGNAHARSMLQALVRGRLLLASNGEEGTTYEIAHEALLNGWDTLRRWVDEQAAHRAVMKRLEAAAAEWERLGRTQDALWSERQVSEAATLAADVIAPNEREFLGASRRAHRRTRILKNSATVLIIVCVVYAVVQLKASRDTEEQVVTHIHQAKLLHDEARQKTADLERIRKEAFAAFDSMKTHEGEAAWARAIAMSTQIERLYGRVSQALESALAIDGNRGVVRDMLADVLYERALAAERDRRPAQRDEFLERMAVYDVSGARRARWSALVPIEMTTSPSGAQVAIQEFRGDDRGKWLLGESHALGVTPIHDQSISQGSFILTVSVAGHAVVQYPVLAARGERLTIELNLPRASDVPDGFVYVPPGRFFFGTSMDEGTRRGFLSTTPVHEVTTEAYLIARHEVTFGEWLTYLRTLPKEERLRRAPKIGEAGLIGSLKLHETHEGAWIFTFQPADQAYTARAGEMLTYLNRRTRAVQDWLRFPVSGISREDADHYIGWLNQTGRLPGARLCTEYEWERAARGGDYREYPHADRLDAEDANFDETYAKEASNMGPDEVGSHPASRSPFGLDDMVGNIFELTVSSLSLNESVIRGGAYFYDNMTALSTNRTSIKDNLRDPRLGFRLCASLPSHKE